MTFGAQTAEDDAFRQLDMAVDAGVTLFDTAENYPAPVSAATQGAASRASQLEANLQGIELHLPKDLLRQIDAIHDAMPNPR